MEVLIVVIGAVIALVLILAVMNRGARRAGRGAGLDESAIAEAHHRNDTRAQQQ